MTAKRRSSAWQYDPLHYTSGYEKKYVDYVLQANKVADLDLLLGKDTRLETRESH